MAANEADTIETLKSYRDIIARLVVRRSGRVVNAPGDALLVEFPSAVEAVQAAIEIQKSAWFDSLGDHVADEILRALINAGADGMTRTAIRDLFGRNQTADRIGA